MARPTPDGYRVRRTGPRTVHVRDDASAERIAEALGFLDGHPRTEPVGTVEGRIPHPVHADPDGDGTLIWKRGHRGGLVGPLLGDRYHRTDRFLRELEVTEAARRAGIPVADIVALAVTRRGLATHSVEWLVRRIEGARDLAETLADRSLAPSRRHASVRAAATTLRRFHAAGLAHGDLNLKNILAHDGPAGDGGEGGTVATLIDLDPAPRSRREGRTAEGNLRRLTRSWLRLSTRRGLVVGATDLWRFVTTYVGGDRSAARELWRRLLPTVTRVRGGKPAPSAATERPR